MSAKGNARPAARIAPDVVWIVTFGFAILHIAATWGRVDEFIWRDVGRWLHEVERFASGQLPYRDFGWQFPPLAIWVLGTWARVVGTGVNAIWVATSAVYILICVQYVRYVRRLVSPAAVLPVVIIGLLLSAAYANHWSAPLPLGMYMPAVPLGFLLLLTAILASLDVLDSGRVRAAWIAGVFAGLAILTKQDFWIPAIYVVTTAIILLVRSNTGTSPRSAVHLAAAFLLTVVAGAVPVLATVGWTSLPDVITGYGSAGIFIGRSLPTWERIAADINVLLALAVLCCVALIAADLIRGVWSRWLIALLALAALLSFAAHTLLDHALRVGGEASNIASVLADHSTLPATMRDVANELMLHALPVALPVLVGIVAIWRIRHSASDRRLHRLAFVLGICIAARSRRGLETVDWYHFLLDLPAYTVALELLIPGRKPVRRWLPGVATAGGIAFGMFSYWYFGVGFLTRHNPEQRLVTPKGVVYVSPHIVRDYHALDTALREADPTGSRPLLVFGYASYNYFLDRPNPSASTAGLRFIRDPSSTIAAALALSPLVLDNLYFARGTLPVPRLHLGSWQQPIEPSFYVTFDRPIFERVIAACSHLIATLPPPPARPQLKLYDCASDS